MSKNKQSILNKIYRIYKESNITISTKTIRNIISFLIAIVLSTIVGFICKNVLTAFGAFVIADISIFALQSMLVGAVYKKEKDDSMVKAVIETLGMDTKQILAHISKCGEITKEINAEDATIYHFFLLKKCGLIDLRCVGLGNYIKVSLNKEFQREIKKYLKKNGIVNSEVAFEKNNKEQYEWVLNEYDVIKKQNLTTESILMSKELESKKNQNILSQMDDVGKSFSLVLGVILTITGTIMFKVLPLLSLNFSTTNWVSGITGLLMTIIGILITTNSMKRSKNVSNVLALATILVSTFIIYYPQNENMANNTTIIYQINGDEIGSYCEFAKTIGVDGFVQDGYTYTTNELVLTTGDKLPDKFINGDVYQNESYIYTYNEFLDIWFVRKAQNN